MEIAAREARGGGFVYWIRSLLVGGALRGSTAVEDRHAPAVLVLGRGGQELVLQRTGTYGQAPRAAAKFRRELGRVGEREFCRRYGLSASLVE